MPHNEATITSHFLRLNKAGGITTTSAPTRDGGSDAKYSYWISKNSKYTSIRSSYVIDSLAENVRLVHSRSHHDVMYALGRRRPGKKHKRPVQQFCTGSRYVGEWNPFGFTGDGIYRYPHGVIYEGEFNKKGQFHGIGTLIYPSGQKVQAMWKNGRLMDGAGYVFTTGEIQDESQKYCQSPDRRYHVEISNDFGAVDQEYITNEPVPKKLPKGCYDVAYGIYDPVKFCIFAPIHTDRTQRPSYQTKDLRIMNEDKYKDLIAILNYQPPTQEDVLAEKDMAHQLEVDFNGHRIIEIPTKEKARWIEQNCRKAWDEPCGYQRNLYKYWLAGRRWEMDRCEAQSLELSRYDINTDETFEDDTPSEPLRTHALVSFIHTISGRRPHRGPVKSITYNRRSSSAKRKTLIGGLKLAEIDR